MFKWGWVLHPSSCVQLMILVHTIGFWNLCICEYYFEIISFFGSTFLNCSFLFHSKSSFSSLLSLLFFQVVLQFCYISFWKMFTWKCIFDYLVNIEFVWTISWCFKKWTQGWTSIVSHFIPQSNWNRRAFIRGRLNRRHNSMYHAYSP